MEVSKAKSVRFSALVQAAGKPTVYLPLIDPERDPKFMRAVKENRVVTLKQEPASTHKEFGVVGYVKEKFVTYLIFEKPLKGFEGNRVVGIKYDVLQDAGMALSPAPKLPEAKTKKAPKPERPKAAPKTFRVRVRITATMDKELTIAAMNQRKAKTEAEHLASNSPDFTEAKITAKTLHVAEE